MLARAQQRRNGRRMPGRHAISRSGSIRPDGAAAVRNARVILANPACDVNGRVECAHPLVDKHLNEALHAYESRVRTRFDRVEGVLSEIAALPRDSAFAANARDRLRSALGCDVPEALLESSWIEGVDMKAVFTHCLFSVAALCVANAHQEQADWLPGMAVDDGFLSECGYHTMDISPCSDGRLQGLLPFVLRVDPTADAVLLKAYAGALFDVELDLNDWAQRELEQRLEGKLGKRYLKVAVYHYSSSAPSTQGCAAHGSNEEAARDAAAQRLQELQTGISRCYGAGLGPDSLLIGLDTDLDSIRVHMPGPNGEPMTAHYIDAARIYRETLSMSAKEARDYIRAAVEEGMRAALSAIGAGLTRLVARLIEANLSQIEYVIEHHEGRYEEIGHGERFICVGDSIDELQLRNLYYYAHLDTLEEGADCVDVGIGIFEKLNLARGFPVPIMMHFQYASMIPGARKRAIERCERVMRAIEARYAYRMPEGALKFVLSVSDVNGTERLALISEHLHAKSGQEVRP